MPSGWFIRNVSTDRRSGQAPFKKPLTARRSRHRNDRSRSRNRRSRCRKHRSRSSEIRSKGCSPDNAACEGFFGRLKTELFYPRQWQATALEQFMQVLDSYIRWYNENRIKISLGSLSPIEYRESLGLMA